MTLEEVGYLVFYKFCGNKQCGEGGFTHAHAHGRRTVWTSLRIHGKMPGSS